MMLLVDQYSFDYVVGALRRVPLKKRGQQREEKRPRCRRRACLRVSLIDLCIRIVLIVLRERRRKNQKTKRSVG